ncbi:DUF2971 domain-containing protein [Pseudomonas sp. DR 5-09]|uniref:DUF2971 domain-containing protein n=1 Tax=Pseudomonas sp. DR 5-09 TaxID=1534110 RepID=UPI0007E44CEF|nr:DUF2971 domain-containing protein [Pseudomonas sp. DR 5-09]
MKRMYHFCNAEHGLQNIEHNRLKIATIQDLNDPFEMLCHDLTEPKARKAVLALKRHFSENVGLFCFSSSYANPVQWAHYADKHKGVCLGFDIDEDDLVKVKYSPSRLAMDAGDILSKSRYRQWLEEFVSTKYSHWKYEREYRVFVDISKKDRAQNVLLQSLSDRIKLRQVIVGCNSGLSRGDVSSVLGGYENSIEVFKVRGAFKKFKMVKNRNPDLWI